MIDNFYKVHGYLYIHHHKAKIAGGIFSKLRVEVSPNSASILC